MKVVNQSYACRQSSGSVGSESKRTRLVTSHHTKFSYDNFNSTYG